MTELRETELVLGEWHTRLGRGAAPPFIPVDDGNVPGWGLPAWREERADRRAFGPGIDRTKWNVRGTEVNNFDYAVVDEAMVYADVDGYMHLTSEFLPTPQHSQVGGGDGTAATNDVITFPSAHGMATYAEVYIQSVSGGALASGYYFVKTVPSSTSVTLTATSDMWPGDLGATVNITVAGTVRMYRPRFMKTGYIDHRPLLAGDISPFMQSYGRWEIRAKPPAHPTQGLGVLAAWWLRNSGNIVVNGNAGGEIDMMESLGSGPVAKTDPGVSTLTFFKYTTVPAGGTQVKEVWKYDDATKAPAGHNDSYSAFHVWTFERMPSYMKAWRDGVLVMSETPASDPSLWGSTYTNPFHLRINLHMGAGSRYWGIPNPAHPEWSALGRDYVIDYVRMWSPPA